MVVFTAFFSRILSAIIVEYGWKTYFFVLSYIVLSLLALVDLYFEFPVFRGNLYLIQLICTVLLIIFLWLYDFKMRERAKEVVKEIKVFHKERREEVTRLIGEDPQFQTLCYKCLHFNQEIRDCALHLYNREMFFKFNFDDKFEYCYYWNYIENPLLLKAVDERHRS